MSSKSVSKSVIWQLGGKFALQGIAFFTTPIFTRLLTPADYGYTALYLSWLSIFGIIIGLGVDGSIGNARIKYGEDKLPGYLSSIMSISLLSFIMVLALLSVFNKWLVPFLGMKKEIVYLLIFHSFFQFVINFEIGKLDALKKVEKSAIISLSVSIIVILLSLFLVTIVKENRAIAKIFGQAIPIITFGLLLLFLTYVKGKTLWNKEYNSFCILLVFPLLFHSLGHLIFSQSDKIMIQKMQDDSSLGVYSIVVSLCSVLSIIYGALNTAWVPFYYDYKKEKKYADIKVHTIRYIKFFTLITCGFILLSYDVYKLMAPEEYWGGMKLLPLLVLSSYFSFLYLFPVNHEFYNAKTKLIPIATFFVSCINILINWLLIPIYGMIGATIATLISHILLFILHEFFARFIVHDYEIEWHFYIPGVFFLLIVIILSYFFMQNVYLRWFFAGFIGLFIVKDLVKQKSIF